MKPAKGFTLIEVLVALVLLSIMAILAWRGLDGMHRAVTQTASHSDTHERLSIALAQWAADWDALTDTGAVKPLEFDGLALRLTRRSPAGQGNLNEGVIVVAWTVRTGHLERYASPAVTSKAETQTAWQTALRWTRTPLPEDARFSSRLLPTSTWQIFYFRSDSWSNAQSVDTALPDGVRLILNLPEGSSLTGKVTRDWVSPSLGATR